MSEKKRINFVVTDLDDTIWDWLSMWHESFEPYIIRISQEFNIDLDELKNDFKKLHQKYKTSEASFIYHELNSIPSEEKLKIEEPLTSGNRKGILHEYYSKKRQNLFLHDGVFRTLKEIKDKGAVVVGFTESNAFFTKYRIKHLNLDGLFDYIYAPTDFDVPQSVYRHYSEEYWEPEFTEFRYLSRETRKPAPEILEIILRDLKANKEHAIYIGDKLDKDIFMANQASIRSVYAKYGHKIDSEQYQLLREVTHWTEEDVQREKEFKKNHSETPIAKYTLKNSFEELNDYFQFFEFPVKSKQKPSIDNIITIWKEIVEVQQHFNDIALRIRNIAITVFTFIIGGIGYIEKENLTLKLGSLTLSYGALLSILGIFIMYAFFYMDKYWYHRLLSGAVNQGLELEKKWGNVIPEIKLANSIGKASPHNWIGTYRKGEKKGERRKIHSDGKLAIFYRLLFVPLIILAIILLFFKNYA